MSLEAIKGTFEFYGGSFLGLGVLVGLILLVVFIYKARK